MSSKRNSGGSGSTRNRRGFSVLGASFAIAMAFFLVIGMIAIAVPEFMNRGNDSQPQLPTFEEPDESEEDRLRAKLEEDPEDADTIIQLADLLANTGRYDESIRYYERGLEHRSDDAQLRVAFAQVLERRGYDLDAEVQLNRVLEDDPENVEAMFLLAQVLERDEPPRTDEADSLYERIIEVSPESFYAQMAEDRLRSDDDNSSDEPAEEE